jgi:hypothetical protein
MKTKFNLKEFLGGCSHVWEEKERYGVIRHFTYYDYDEPNHKLIILRCKKCGKMKEYKI